MQLSFSHLVLVIQFRLLSLRGAICIRSFFKLTSLSIVALLKTNPKLRDILLKGFRPFLKVFFRPEVFYEEELSKQPVLFISNHNIGAPFEVLILLDSLVKNLSNKNSLYIFTHRFPFKIPILKRIFEKMGAVPAEYLVAAEIFNLKKSLLIFPGGNYESVRPFSQRNSTDFGEKKGWVKIASENPDTQVAPITISGSHGVNPVLWRSKTLARLLVVPYFLEIKWFPVTLAQILLVLIFFSALKTNVSGVSLFFICYFIFLLTVQFPLFPVKIRIRIGKGVSFSEVTKGIKNENEKIDYFYHFISRKIRDGMNFNTKNSPNPL